MLFQMFPYKKVKDAEGKTTTETTQDGKRVINDTTKYQFDAGGPNFMDITDRPVAPAFIAETYPYLYTDLSTALKQNKDKMEQAFKDLAGDPTLQADDFKIKTYEIDDEIEKLHKFVERGYFTDKVRSKAKADQEKNTETPETPKQVTQSPPQGEPQMEKVDKDVAAMLSSLKKYDRLVESVAPVLGMKTLTGQKMEENVFHNPNLPADKQLPDPPEEIEMDIDEGDMEEGNEFSGELAKAKSQHQDEFTVDGETYPVTEDEMVIDGEIEEAVRAWDKRTQSTTGGYPVTQDERDSLAYRVKKNRAAHRDQFQNDPVGSEKMSGSWAGEENNQGKWKKLSKIGKGITDQGDRVAHQTNAPRRPDNFKGDVGVKPATGSVNEQADPDVLAWMNRFAKLGNMKGYGR
jgi:hypothetical protein